MSSPVAERIELFFDPGCPWTWKTAQWLRRTGVPVEWRAFRLELGIEGPVPGTWATAARGSQLALRLVEHLAASGRHTDTDLFYAAVGERVHEGLQPMSADLVRSVAGDLGLGPDAVSALDDDGLDGAVRAAYDDAVSLVGPGLGSPVLAVTFADGRRRGVFGPIVTAPLDEPDALRLWDAIVTALSIDALAELKRARDLHLPLDASLSPHV